MLFSSWITKVEVRQIPLTPFSTFDLRQAQAARSLGFTVLAELSRCVACRWLLAVRQDGSVNVPTGRTRGRPPGGTPVADRDAILAAAERVIGRDGPGASLDAVAAEAGITKPIVYARVGPRAELANALAERLTERIVVAVGAGIGTRPPSRETLAWLFRTVLETIGTHRNVFLYVTGGSPGDTTERLTLAGRSAEPLSQLLAQWRQQHGHDPSVARTWAYAITGMLNMVALWWLDQGRPPVGALSDALADLVWSGMLPDRVPSD